MNNNKRDSRRKFIKQLAAGTIGVTLADKLSPVFAANPILTGMGKSKVVLVKHSKVINTEGQVSQNLIQEMINKGMTEFTGKSTLKDAWSQFFSSEDLISLKMNTLGVSSLQGTDLMQHFTGVSDPVLNGLREISIPDKKLLIWERSDEELVNGGYAIQREEGSLRIMGTREMRRGENEGFNPESFPVGDKTTRVHSFITDLSTSYINIPVLKTHGIAGLTASLKNHYGSIDNPREFHENNATNPGIPEINAIPIIRDKQKLIIADALLGVFDGGPRWNREMIWPFGGLIFGTDPVAVDSIMYQILEEKRIKEELEPIESKAIHLQLSEELGLGNHKHENIDLVEINLG